MVIFAVSLGSSIKYGTTPMSPDYHFSDYRPGIHAKNIEEIKKMIPEKSSISIQHNLGSHFSEREYLYRFPLGQEKSEYILLDQFDPYGENDKQAFNFSYALQMDGNDWKSTIEKLRKSEKYDLVYDYDRYLLFKLK